MKARTYKGLVVEGRIPTIRDGAVATGLTVALANQATIGLPAALGIGVLALGSIRVRRAPADDQVVA
ncbi:MULTISPECIES: hypothetical protein [Streptomyces]|uniref:hypothetical protein n=1 Tax=Streptomyces TaxID=1883 RepID=UPI0022500521|nr:hypothetical protein [Streptomyces viridodiastaticus]MCX4618008.1 hypothetical protein [Streptomyces viridodiastaticus]MCX4625032.1 hypothetical protein [Streptomyces viridodiastaticus]